MRVLTVSTSVPPVAAAGEVTTSPGQARAWTSGGALDRRVDGRRTRVRPSKRDGRRDRDIEFDEFYRAEADGVYRALALALGDQQTAQEATHEGMARAYQKWSRIRDYERPAGWVYRVGLNWARSRLRKTGREVLTREPEIAPPVGTDLDPDLRRALAQLSLEARSVVVLRYLLEWSTEDTATALGIAPGTVKSRLARALVRLGTLLEERP